MKRNRGLPSYPGSKALYIMIASLTFIESIAITAQAIFIARAVTSLFHGSHYTDVLKEIALFLLSFLIRHALAIFKRYLSERFAEKMGRELREQLIDAYFKNGQLFARSYGTGRLVTLAIEGIDQLKKYIEIAVPRMIQTAIIPVVIVIYVFTVDKASAIILVATVPIIIIFMILLGLAAQKMADSQYETYRVLSNHFIDSLKGIETLKYLGQSVKHEGKISRVSGQYRKATMKTLRVAFLSSFALDFFTSLSIAFVAVGLGFRLIDGAMTLFPALTILILAPEYFLPLRQVGSDYHATLDGQIALSEIEQIIDIQKDLPAPTNIELPKLNNSFQLDLTKVGVTHEDTQILTDISFSCSYPGMIGIVGESGAGKSTLINLLAGFLDPSHGGISLNGVKVDSLKQPDWLENIAYIPQHPYIFPTSLANNVRFYEPEASDEDVKNVLRKIGMEDFIKTLPKGIHERLGEGGRMLSGGQEQRVAIARALLSKRQVILLDEPTAHLDIETEFEVKQLMMELFKNKLVFFATHRLHWMKEMDHLIVLDHGRIVEQGQRDDLLKNEGKYYELENMVYKGGVGNE